MMRARQPLLTAPIREVRQWHPYGDDTHLYRWDVLWQDPASGRLQQVYIEACVDPASAEYELPFLRETSRAALSRIINRKCGIRAARFLPLPLPIGTPARYV